jgi:hypothetical protein
MIISRFGDGKRKDLVGARLVSGEGRVRANGINQVPISHFPIEQDLKSEQRLLFLM